MTPYATTILYRMGSWDGVVSAWLLYQEFFAKGVRAYSFREREPLRRNHFSPGQNLWILDIEWWSPRDYQQLNRSCHRMTRISKHEKACCRIVWEKFRHGQSKIVDYVEDIELGKRSLPLSAEIEAFLRSHPINVDSCSAISEWLEMDLAGAVEHGRTVLRREGRSSLDALDQPSAVKLGGLRFLVPSWPVEESLLEETATGLAKASKTGHGAAWAFVDGGTRVRWRLESKSAPEVTWALGGQGREGTTGFSVSIQKHYEILGHGLVR